MKNVMLKKENNQVRIIDITDDNELCEINNINCRHLCGDSCLNARADKCPKIEDLKKESIDKYPFIVDGYQVYDENGELNTFIVSKCENYKEEIRRKKNKEEINRLKAIKESIRVAYFDTDTIDEAYLLQDEFINSKRVNNKLIRAKGDRPTDYQLRMIKKRAMKNK